MTLNFDYAKYLLCFLLGYGACVKLQPPAPPKPLEIAASTQAGSKALKTTHEKFNCPNGALSERDTSEDVTSFLNSQVKAKIPPPAAPPMPDNFMALADSTLRFTALVNPSSALPILPSNMWVGYAKDLHHDEDIYVVGWSRRIP